MYLNYQASTLKLYAFVISVEHISYLLGEEEAHFSTPKGPFLKDKECFCTLLSLSIMY